MATVSPDGRKAAGVWTDTLMLMYWSPIGAGQSQYLLWCDLARPESVKAVTISQWFGALMIENEEVMDVAFSPDSRRVALVTQIRGIVVDTETGESMAFTPVGARLSSFAWRGPKELVYCTHEKEGPAFTRRVWRHRLTAGPQERVLVYEGPGDAGVSVFPIGRGGWRSEYWAPGGEDALLATGRPQAALAMLHVETGQIRPLGPMVWAAHWVSWSHDGRRCVCIGHPDVLPVRPTVTSSARCQAILLDTAGGVTDITPEIADALGSGSCQVEPFWRSDGKVAVTTRFGQGLLLDPVVRTAVPAPVHTRPDGLGWAQTPDGSRVVHFPAKDKVVIRPAAQ